MTDGAGVDDAATGAALARALRRLTPADAAARLGAVARTRRIESIAARSDRWRTGLEPGDPVTGGPFAQIVRADHPGLGVVDVLAPGYARLDRDPLRVPTPARKPGADTRAVLGAVGFGAAEIDAMIASGAAAEQLSADWLPP